MAENMNQHNTLWSQGWHPSRAELLGLMAEKTTHHHTTVGPLERKLKQPSLLAAMPNYIRLAQTVLLLLPLASEWVACPD
jgi:hypothetical protein